MAFQKILNIIIISFIEANPMAQVYYVISDRTDVVFIKKNKKGGEETTGSKDGQVSTVSGGEVCVDDVITPVPLH
ncbi:hypothetical protein E2C01_049976 [Portunus trituberculatus]|uniref:Uncharacterized protein n=1 Tax=Portunus trituberculatus TaxID=210409 RepID=A0A5B7GFF0_PORTR|nr:hypothetical protein [Portunus trituberculatus]